MKFLILGGTGAIGGALAERSRCDGHHCVISGRKLAADLVADLTTPAGIDVAAAAAERADAVIFSAGIWRFAGLNRFSAGELEQTLAINLVAPMEITRRIIPAWRARGSGILVYILSELAHKPQAGGAIYCATKHGLYGFAASLRMETRDAGLRVVTVSPGIVGGDQGMTPEELAERIATALAGGEDDVHVPTPPPGAR
jgi:short-subunit dehydrogenase